jgi:high-affinity nickel permease
MTPDSSLSAALVAGFVLGMRHALDADHLAAVSTLVSQHRGIARSCLMGTIWGLGHTIALLVAALAVIALKLTISPAVERTLEALVALMLVALGGHVLLRAIGQFHVHRHAHAHGPDRHEHVHVHVGGETAHDHGHVLRAGRRPLLVGLMHGLAGSAALTVLVVGTLSSTLAAVAYIVVFGLGSTLGMLIVSGVIGIPFALTASRSHVAHGVIQLLSGAATLVLGLVVLGMASTASG